VAPLSAPGGAATGAATVLLAAEAVVAGTPAAYEKERRRLGAGSDWLGRWLLRATRYPAIADRVVESLGTSPDLFTKLLEIATGTRPPGDFTLVEKARLIV